LTLAFLAGALMGTADAQQLTHLLEVLQPGSRLSPGLGGDPFLSPLSGQSNWWTSAADRLHPHVTVTHIENAPATERLTDRQGALTERRSTVAWSQPFVWRDRKLYLRSTLNRFRITNNWRGTSGVVDLDGEGSQAQVVVHVQDVLPGLSVQAGFPLWTSSTGEPVTETGFGLRWDRGRRLQAQVSWLRTRHSGDIRTDLHAEPIDFSTNLQLRRLRGDVRYRVLNRLYYEGSLQRADADAIEPKHQHEAYEFLPDGVGWFYQNAAVWGIHPDRQLVFRHTHANLNYDGNAYWGGQRFGRLSRLDAIVDSYLLGIQLALNPTTRGLLDLEWVTLDGELRTWVESWPFTSALIDLLGMRKDFKVIGEVNWLRLHLGLEKAFASTDLRCGATWYEIRPDGYLKTWLPVIAGLGQTDVRYYHLEPDRIQVAALSLGARQQLGRTTFSVALEQFVHARVHGLDEAVIDPPATDEREEGWFGGTFLRLSLTLSF